MICRYWDQYETKKIEENIIDENCALHLLNMSNKNEKVFKFLVSNFPDTPKSYTTYVCL